MENFFDRAYRETPPWDVGEAQPGLLALLDEFPPAGPVLDVGCGTGTLALALARRGLSTLGVDLAAAAIEKARAKAEAAGLAGLAAFQVGDALRPAHWPGPFGAVVDTGFFHLFGPAERAAFAGELAAALAPGGRFYLLGFAITAPVPNAPRLVSAEELGALFAPEGGWRVLALRPAQFVTRAALGQVPALAGCFERAAAG